MSVAVYAVPLVLLSLAVLSLMSCGAGSGRFRIEGRFRNLNRGEFYVYSPDGGIRGRDTIKVADGRFAYDIPLETEATFILIFPNFSEQAVFGASGATVKISGDASHLREMEIEGTDDNELMTKFRMRANRLSPPEVTKAAAEFIGENPASPVSLYLVNRYFVQTPQPDYRQAHRLASAMLKADPDNGRLEMFCRQLDALKASDPGSVLPDFSATDISGKRVGKSVLGGEVNIISAWASWNYTSQNMQRQMKTLKKDYGDRLGLLSICVDARIEDCERCVKYDSIPWPNVCDGRMWDSPLMVKFGMATVPGNLITDRNGKIIARNLNAQQLKEKLESTLK